MKISKQFYIALAILIPVGIGIELFFYLRPVSRRERWVRENLQSYVVTQAGSRLPNSTCLEVIAKARALTQQNIQYDPAYFNINFPLGDIPNQKGVCADIIVRSLRAVKLDLQELIYEDMKQNFSKYPALWSLSQPDPNIDHRRVPNMMVYFQRHGETLSLSSKASDYSPCDIVAYDLGGGVTHIGLVSDQMGQSSHPLLIHHIGGRPKEEDQLFSWKIIGHYRVKL